MRDDFYEEQFQAKALSPAFWALSARRLKLSADIVFDKYDADLTAIVNGASSLELHHLELAGCASLLYGLSLENVIKANYIQVHPDVIKDGRLRRWPSDGHDLVVLSKEAGLQIDSTERDLLSRLTAHIRWAGRYPTPKSPDQMRLRQNAYSSDFVPMPIQPFEREQLNKLYDRFESFVLQELP